MWALAAGIATSEALWAIRRPPRGAIGMVCLLAASEIVLVTLGLVVLNALVDPAAWIAAFLPYLLALFAAPTILRANLNVLGVRGRTRTLDPLKLITRQRKRWMSSIDERTSAFQVTWAETKVVPKLDSYSLPELCRMAAAYYAAMRRIRPKRRTKLIGAVNRIELDHVTDEAELRRILVNVLLNDRGRPLVLSWVRGSKRRGVTRSAVAASS